VDEHRVPADALVRIILRLRRSGLAIDAAELAFAEHDRVRPALWQESTMRTFLAGGSHGAAL